MSLSSMFSTTMDVYDLSAFHEATADESYLPFAELSAVPCDVQPLDQSEMTSQGDWDVRATHKVFYKWTTVLESRHRLKIANDWYDIVSVKFASVRPQWPSRAHVRKVSVP